MVFNPKTISEPIPIAHVDENGNTFYLKHVCNKLRVNSKPFSWDVVDATMPNHTAFRRYGHNENCGATLETVFHGSVLYTYLTSAERLYIVSGDAADATAGIGARTVVVRGLDADYNIIQETVTMNGTTHVLTTKSFLRVFNAWVSAVGATGYNEGAITVKNTVEDNTLAVIAIQECESHACIWTVPAGEKAYITNIHVSESSGKGSDVSLWIRNTPDSKPWRYKRGIYTLDNFIPYRFTFPVPLSEKYDVEIRVKAILAGAKVAANFEGWYEPE